nr:MAG TPA: hypothetical protein [Caudoviricetes sp.]
MDYRLAQKSVAPLTKSAIIGAVDFTAPLKEKIV